MSGTGMRASGARAGSGIVAACVALVLVLVLGGGVARAEPTDDQVRADEALEAWDLGEARGLVGRLNSDDSADAFNVYLTGKLALMEGRYGDALEKFEAAQSKAPSPIFAHYIEIAKNTRDETKGYVQHTTAGGHFIISTLPGVDEVLVPYAEDALERAYRELTRIFDYVPEGPVRVEIYPTVDVLGAVSPLTVAEIRTSGTIALCKYNRLMVTSPRDLVYGYDWLDTLSHEFIHLLITKKSRNQVPIWIHEGLAKYYEVKWRPEVQPALDRHSEGFLAKAIAGDSLISFEAMSPSMAKLPSQEATATAFAEVWTVIAFLNARKNGDSAAELVKLIGDGHSDRDAVAKVANIGWDRFEKAWKQYLQQQGFRALDAAYEQRLLFKGKDTQADELSSIKIERAREFVWLGDRLRLKKRWVAAAKEYEKAKEHVGDKSPLVQGKYGYALLKAGRVAEAASELARPIADYPRYVVLRVYLGDALAKLERWAEARAELEEALTMNPFDPDLHRLLAEVYEHLGERAKAEVERKADRLTHP